MSVSGNKFMWNYITNQNYVRTLANLQLSFIKFYVLLNSAWFLYFFLFSSWLWKVVSLIIAYKIGLWWSSLMMYRKVASCLLQSFLCARKQREEDIVNFSQVFVGQARKESALLFNEKFGDFCKKKSLVTNFLMAVMQKLELCFLVLLLRFFCRWHTLLKDEKLFFVTINSTFIWVMITGKCGIVVVQSVCLSNNSDVLL